MKKNWTTIKKNLRELQNEIGTKHGNDRCKCCGLKPRILIDEIEIMLKDRNIEF